jgi:hypothetical protein
MTDSSPRLGLPFILPGQAQKELFHNEALLRLDFLLQAAVEGPPSASPPANPQEGQCWIVAEGASGEWSGRTGSLAGWSEGGWRFIEPRTGMSVWNKADAVQIRWDGSAWTDGEITCSGVFVGGLQVVGQRHPGVPSPSGGTIIDAEARAAIGAIIAALMSHGLIE